MSPTARVKMVTKVTEGMLFVRRPTRLGVSWMTNRMPIHGILLLGGTGSRMRSACVGNKHRSRSRGAPWLTTAWNC